MSYVDNAVPFGSRIETIKRGDVTTGGTPVGTYILESISLTHPSKIIERPNHIGEPNGWVAVQGFSHGTCVIQIPTDASEYPKIGDWFQDEFNITTLFGEQGVVGSLQERSPTDTVTWVIVDITQPFAIADYFKANATIRLQNFFVA